MAGVTDPMFSVRSDEPDGDSFASDLLASRTRVEPLEEVIDLREPAPDDDPDVLRPLVGKVAVVTGGGGPVGRAIALALLDAGARVCVLGSDAESLRETTQSAGPSARILYLQCDLGSVSDVSGAADFIARFDRPVDVLVHAANVHVRHGIAGGVIADLDEQYLVNLRGPYLMTQQLLPQLRQGPGHVVFISPVAGDPVLGDVQFAMTSAGADALAEGLRREVGPAGIRVSTIRVGRVIDPTDEGTGDAAVEGIHADDIADCVIGAVEMPDRVEIADLRLRPQSADA